MCRMKMFIIIAMVFYGMEEIAQASFLFERKTFSAEQFERFGFALDPVSPQGMLAILQQLYEINDQTLDKSEMQQQVFFTDVTTLDINHDDRADILALVNHRITTANPVEVLIIYSIANGWAAQTLRTDRGQFKETVLDVNNDGLYEICVNEPIQGETLRFFEQYWIHIYAWDGEAYIESDAQFVESFYPLHYLPRLEKQLNDVKTMINNETSQKIASGVLHDIQTALERISTLARERQNAHDQKMNNDLNFFCDNVERITNQIKYTRELLQRGESLNTITSSLEIVQEALQQMSLSHY